MMETLQNRNLLAIKKVCSACIFDLQHMVGAVI